METSFKKKPFRKKEKKMKTVEVLTGNTASISSADQVNSYYMAFVSSPPTAALQRAPPLRVAALGRQRPARHRHRTAAAAAARPRRDVGGSELPASNDDWLRFLGLGSKVAQLI